MYSERNDVILTPRYRKELSMKGQERGYKIIRVDMSKRTVSYEALPKEWMYIGGRGLIAKILNREVDPHVDPLGKENKLIIACGSLAGTNAPQLGRISFGAKSPLTLGIKESNAGGPAAQKLDRLRIRAIIIQGTADPDSLLLLNISKAGVKLLDSDKYRSQKIIRTVEDIYKEHGGKPTIITVGPAGERKYKAASIVLTDIYGNPSRNAGRGGLGAVMGSKGLKAIVINDSGTAAVPIADKEGFRETVREWISLIQKDVICGLFASEGTPFTISSNSYQGTMPGNNYRTGRPEGFKNVTGQVTRRRVWERGGKMHACMPGCIVQCSILYVDEKGNKFAGYEYEAVAMIGTNLGITDTDKIALFKHICDDIGVDFIEIGSALGVAGEAGKLKLGDADYIQRILEEIEEGTELGRIIGDGVVSTAHAFNVKRVPVVKGQAVPAHDPRAVKGMGVTYATRPMGADHTAGLTYRNPLSNKGQVANSLRFQLRAAACDTFGYCLNSVPGREASIYKFLASLLNARYGIAITSEDVLETAKQTIRDELRFNAGSEFSTVHEPFPEFLRKEALPPSGHVFDVDESEIRKIWDMMEEYQEPDKAWEVRFPKLPDMLFGTGVFNKLGERAKKYDIKKALIIADPVMKDLGRIDEIVKILKKSSVDSAIYTAVEPDPPVESIERAGQFYKEQECTGIIALGGGSSIDTAKVTAVRVSHDGPLMEFENMVGGKAKIKPTLPPLICIPTTSGTGSETNQYAVVTDPERELKITIMSDYMVPKLAVIDPLLCSSMPKAITAETGIDALSHCIEGFVGMNDEYHPYYAALAHYGVKLIGRSLRRAYENGKDISARKDMCMAASFGGIAFTKGLALGHAISHALGALHHISHGKGCALGLLCHVKANEKVCKEQFKDLALALDRSTDLLDTLARLYRDIGILTRIRDLGIREEDLPEIAFEVSMNAVNLAANPLPVKEHRILQLLKEIY